MTPDAFKTTLALLGWSQRTVANLLGVLPMTIHRYASGDRQIPADVANWLAAAARFFRDNPPPKR